MPNRILKESINESKGLAECSAFAQDMFKRLITYADDYGRFNSDAALILARLYPRELDAVSCDDISDGLVELIGVGKVKWYTCAGRHDVVYGYLPGWTDHQRIRNTRAKFPEPESENINDWALRRFIPIALRVALFERDGFKCQECGLAIPTGQSPVRRAIRLLAGAFHADHIVPVRQGGRATLENLRILCASCNLRRPRSYPCDELPQVAADCRHARPESNPIQSNPIQSGDARAREGSPLPAPPPPAPPSQEKEPDGTDEQDGQVWPDHAQKAIQPTTIDVVEMRMLMTQLHKRMKGSGPLSWARETVVDLLAHHGFAEIEAAIPKLPEGCRARDLAELLNGPGRKPPRPKDRADRIFHNGKYEDEA